MSKRDPLVPPEEHIKEIEAKWAAESEERIEAVDRCELQTIDGPSAVRDLRSSLT